MKKHNRAIPMPEAGENAILALSIEDLEKLEEHYDSRDVPYLTAIGHGLDQMRPAVIKHVLSIALKGGDPNAALNALPMAELSTRLADAISLIVYGRRMKESDDAAA